MIKARETKSSLVVMSAKYSVLIQKLYKNTIDLSGVLCENM